MAPIAVSLIIFVLHWAAAVNAFIIIQIKVRVTRKALILGWSIAGFTIREAALADCSVSPESERAFRYTLRILRGIEAENVEIRLAGKTIIEIGATGTARIAQSTSKTVPVSEIASGTATQTATTI